MNSGNGEVDKTGAGALLGALQLMLIIWNFSLGRVIKRC